MRHSSETELIIITPNTLNINEALDFIILPWTGGTSCFLGTTRNTFENKKVKTLFYEAYEPMAMKELCNICKTVRANYEVGNICLMHRIGEVTISETSVIVAVSSIHRKEAISAAEMCIDEIKARVPIWKKEIYEDDSSSWKENKETFWLQKEDA